MYSDKFKIIAQNVWGNISESRFIGKCICAVTAATNGTPCISRFISWATLLFPPIADSFEAPFNGRSRLDTQTRQELSYGGREAT